MSEQSKPGANAGPVIVLVVVMLLLGGGLFGLNQWEAPKGGGNSTSSGGTASTSKPSSGDAPKAGSSNQSSSSKGEPIKDKLLAASETPNHPGVIGQVPPKDLVVMLFPEDLEQQEQMSQEYDQLLDASPEYKQILMADKDAWDELVSKVESGELDPNEVVGEKVQRFEHTLRERLQRAEKPTKTSEQPEPDVALKTVFDKALTSRETKVSHIRKLLKHGAKPTSVQMKNVILSAMEEPDKLKKIKLLVEKGVDVNGPESDMSSLDASMVWGDVGIAKYLIHKGAKPDVGQMKKIARTFQPKSRLGQSEAFLATL